MTRVLYISANPKQEHQSYSLSVGRKFLEAYREKCPEDEIIELDLYNLDQVELDLDVFNGWEKLQQGILFENLTLDEKAKITRINEITEQFIGADKYIFASPLWNFSIPPRLKAYIDCICIAGKTFQYTFNGAVGLLTDKKAIHIQARGGVYSEGPLADMEFGDRYIQVILRFLGVQNTQSLYVEGMGQSPEEASEIKQKAIAKALLVANDF